MANPFFIAFGAILFAAALGVFFWRPAHPTEQGGKIGKVRVQKVDDHETILILDFNLRNTSDRPKTVADTTARLHGADGAVVEGSLVGAAALANIFQNYPLLGEQYNPALKAMDELKPGQAVDRTVAIRFDAPDETIAGRKDLLLDVAYINGPIVEMKTP